MLEVILKTGERGIVEKMTEVRQGRRGRKEGLEAGGQEGGGGSTRKTVLLRNPNNEKDVPSFRVMTSQASR